jgi:Helix-hairpin-helix motif
VLLRPLTLGLLGRGSFVYAGVRARRRLWVAFGLAYLALAVLAFVFLGIDDNDDDRGLEDWAGALILLLWGGTFVHALVIRKDYLDRMDLLEDPRLDRAEDLEREREHALHIVQSDPSEARAIGIGRPDLPGTFHGGLVDVNHAAANALAGLPGFDAALAQRVVSIREEIDGFDSLDDLGHVLGLPAVSIDRIRECAVAVPRV